jgi:ribosomal protein S18 acetylase RimI-like enzyme
MMNAVVREISPDDYEALVAFWAKIDGIELDSTETQERFQFFLMRNKGKSFLVIENGEIVGACLASHNGRRGFLNHLAVAQTHRRKGLARKLVDSCLQKLQTDGIRKIYVVLLKDNTEGPAFWKHMGWSQHHEYLMMSIEKDITRSID